MHHMLPAIKGPSHLPSKPAVTDASGIPPWMFHQYLAVCKLHHTHLTPCFSCLRTPAHPIVPPPHHRFGPCAKPDNKPPRLELSFHGSSSAATAAAAARPPAPDAPAQAVATAVLPTPSDPAAANPLSIFGTPGLCRQCCRCCCQCCRCCHCGSSTCLSSTIRSSGRGRTVRLRQQQGDPRSCWGCFTAASFRPR